MAVDLADLVGALNGVQVTVAGMDGKLTGLVAGQSDHETRIRSLEQWRWTVQGKVAAWSALGGITFGAIAGAVAAAVIHQ